MSARWGPLPVTAQPRVSGPMPWALEPAVPADTRPVERGSLRWWVGASAVAMVSAIAASVTTLVLAGQVCL